MTVLLTGLPPREGLPSIDHRLLRSRAARMLGEVSRGRAELSITLVDDATIASLNRRYRNEPHATDVLSFSLLEGEFSDRRGELLGDVVISVETAARQARAAHRGVDEVVARLLIHGMLHLLGYDHEEERDARRMRAEERRLWRAIRA